MKNFPRCERSNFFSADGRSALNLLRTAKTFNECVQKGGKSVFDFQKDCIIRIEREKIADLLKTITFVEDLRKVIREKKKCHLCGTPLMNSTSQFKHLKKCSKLKRPTMPYWDKVLTYEHPRHYYQCRFSCHICGLKHTELIGRAFCPLTEQRCLSCGILKFGIEFPAGRHWICIKCCS